MVIAITSFVFGSLNRKELKMKIYACTNCNKQMSCRQSLFKHRKQKVCQPSTEVKEKDESSNDFLGVKKSCPSIRHRRRRRRQKNKPIESKDIVEKPAKEFPPKFKKLSEELFLRHP